MDREGYLRAMGFVRVRLQQVPADLNDDTKFIQHIDDAWRLYSGVDVAAEDLDALKAGQADAAAPTP